MVKMGKAKYLAVTLVPLVFLVVVTFSASYEKIFSPNPRIGFLADAQHLAAEIPASAARAHELSVLAFNDRLDAVVTGVLVVLVAMIVVEAALEWISVLSGKKAAEVREAPFVPSRLAAEEL